MRDRLCSSVFGTPSAWQTKRVSGQAEAKQTMEPSDRDVSVTSRTPKVPWIAIGLLAAVVVAYAYVGFESLAL